jgi:hypothetical protein
VLGWPDAAFATGIIVCLILVLSISAAAGILKGPGALF